jgi:outer membrane protein TolC
MTLARLASPATRPTGGATAQPDGISGSTGGRRTLVAGATAQQPVQLDTKTIVLRVFDTSPTMQASRELKTAAGHGLEEFRANLSRLEPYVETSGDTSAYPERRDASGYTGEAVGGVQKETFEGAILKVEGGVSASEFRYGQVGKGEESVSRGSGGLLRTRVEVPFIGSRRRQERVINQAFQESQSRKARLDYLTDFRTNITDALSYYQVALLYQDYARVAEKEAQVVELLLSDARIRGLDRARLASTMESSRVTRDQYRTSQRTYVLMLLSTLGLPMEQPVVLAERSGEPSPYLDQLSTPQGRDAMIQMAYENNPRFRVLQNAINDAELQRQQAIIGRYDVTAFMQGTMFPFGASAFDDRLGGWLVGGGVNVRLNDNRVLTASRLKAEAQVRQFKAEIEAERLTIQRKIIDNGEQLQSYQKILVEAREVARKKNEAYKKRVSVYVEGSNPKLMVDDLITLLQEWIVAENRLAANRYYIGLAELQLMTASGEMYRIAGMDIHED